MNKKLLIHNAEIVNGASILPGSVLVEDGDITAVYRSYVPGEVYCDAEIIDATGLYLFPGVIDDQVHFREPGLTHKGDIYTESKAAVAGGTTSFMEMPNTKPQAVTLELLEEKYALAAEKSMANYSFYMGATNDNLDEILKIDPATVCGVKVFMGSSTGNMLVDNRETLERIFKEVPLLITTHCEDEATIKENTERARQQFGDDVPIEQHPVIRDAEACYRSSSLAVELAKKHNARLHILHLSSAKELSLFDGSVPTQDKRITAEVCVHHLLFDETHYAEKGALIKWNPSVKSKADREALLQALIDGRIDVVATDHAPHLLSEKEGGALKAMSGGPMVQHSLLAMLELVKQGVLTYEQVVQKMCHAPALLFGVKRRGYISKGYRADLVLVDPTLQTVVAKENLLYKCGWSPLEGTTFNHKIVMTFVNGQCVYNNGNIDETVRGERLMFEIK
jgi:dihydroorotase